MGWWSRVPHEAAGSTAASAGGMPVPHELPGARVSSRVHGERAAAAPALLVVSDRRHMGADPIDAVLGLRRAGVPAFQWREKDLSPGESYATLHRLRDRLDTEPTRAPGGAAFRVFVNDRADLALALGFGVHLTGSSMPTQAARRILPPTSAVGRSVHSADQAMAAQADGADYVVFGPVFDTPSKRVYGAPQGLAALRAVCERLRIPVLAIGGIDASRVAACRESGAGGVCVIRAVWDSEDPAGAARALLEEWPPA